MKTRVSFCFLFLLVVGSLRSSAKLFIPMNAGGQTNHLKAYGIVYHAVAEGIKVEWLLNYTGGSFVMDDNADIESLCRQRGVSYHHLADKEYAKIRRAVTAPSFNGAIVTLEKAPKIAVYTPPNKEPWDDAVTLALTYAEIPFDKIYATDVLNGALNKYDWMHLHHEDFTGQYGKFWGQFRNAGWYKNDKAAMEALAAQNGYKKVSQMQLAVVKKIRDFVGAGGNLFAMCSATETFDIALAADGQDICDTMFDGDPANYNAALKLDYSKCFAFRNFSISMNPYEYGHSDIDNTRYRMIPKESDYFELVTPSAQLDLVPVMLCQDHTNKIPGFMGQTTAFRRDVIKPNVMILGEQVQPMQVTDANGTTSAVTYPQNDEVRYIHGEYGKGTWTFLGGHDPEAYAHRVGDAPTDLALHPNSPGYRLILNNVLVPAVKKNVVPTVVVNEKKTPAETEAVQDATPVNKVKLYPNPAKDELVISVTSGTVQQVIIYNIGGKEQISHIYNTENATVDLHSLAPGMYLVKVNGEYVGKVVKD